MYKKNNDQGPQGEFVRVRLPRDKEILAVVEQRLGASKMRVKCFDGLTRIARIPGRLKSRLWVRENDIVLIEPWEYAQKDKGDVLYKYNPTQVQVLRKKGLLETPTTKEF